MNARPNRDENENKAQQKVKACKKIIGQHKKVSGAQSLCQDEKEDMRHKLLALKVPIPRNHHYSIIHYVTPLRPLNLKPCERKNFHLDNFHQIQ